MGDRNRSGSGFLASLATLGKSLVDLRRAFEGKAPVAGRDTVSHADSAPHASTPLSLPEPEPHSEDAQLLTQHTPGWHVPHPTRLPVPTFAPVMTAFGIVFIALGAVTMWLLSVLGVLIFVAGIAKWIGELLYD